MYRLKPATCATSKIFIVGCGLGSARHLTQEAIAAVDSSEALVGYKRLMDLFPCFKGVRIVLGSNVKAGIEQIEALRHLGNVAVLVSGDPGCFSLAKLIVKRFGREKCIVIPGISSVQTAFARLCLEWADARIVSVHGSFPDEEEERTLLDQPKIAVLLGKRDSIPWLTSFLKKASGSRRIFVCQNLGLDDESVTEVTETELATLTISSRTVVILLEN